jgi:Tol biopolymer transport system component
VGDITSTEHLAWFPDGKHVLLDGATEGQPMRTFEMDLEGGKPQPIGPADFIGAVVAKDGKRIAGRNASADAVMFDKQTGKLQAIPGIGHDEEFEGFTEDGRALLVSSATPWGAEVYRVDAATGKRNLLQKIEPSERAGSVTAVKLSYAELSKTYVYGTARILGTLYEVEGLE